MEEKNKINALRKKIDDHNYHYYVLDSPIISDYEYDDLLRNLQDLEKKNPDLITSNSPTQRVGAKPLDAFDSIEHSIPMLSLENAMDADELIAYYDSMFSEGTFDYSKYIADPTNNSVNTIIKGKVTVNFQNVGKKVINSENIKLEKINE